MPAADNCRSGGRGRTERCSPKDREFRLADSPPGLGPSSCSRFTFGSGCSDDPTLLLALDVRPRGPILA
jgi:hypothetical protein